jgi:hypothetical protein
MAEAACRPLSARNGIAALVLGAGDGLKMKRLHTSPLPTEVIEFHADRDRPTLGLVDNTVS